MVIPYRTEALHVKTTPNLNDEVLRRCKRPAARDGITLTRFVEDALRAKFVPKAKPRFRLKLLTVHGNRAPNVDITDRDALYDMTESPRY